MEEQSEDSSYQYQHQTAIKEENKSTKLPQPTTQEIQYVISHVRFKYPHLDPKAVFDNLYIEVLKQQRKKNKFDNAGEIQPYLYRVYAPEAGRQNVFYDGMEYWKTLGFLHQKERFIITRKIIHAFCVQGYGLTVFRKYIKANQIQQSKFPRQEYKKYLISALRNTTQRMEDFISLNFSFKVKLLTRYQFDNFLPKLLSYETFLSPQIARSFLRALRITYDLPVDTPMSQKQLVKLYKDLRLLINRKQLQQQAKLFKKQQRKLNRLWCTQIEENLLAYLIQTRKVNEARQKLAQKYPQHAKYFNSHLILSKIDISLRAAIKWLIITADKSDYRNPLELPQEDRISIVRANELLDGRLALLKVYLRRNSCDGTTQKQRAQWKQQFYDQIFKVLGIIQDGLIKLKNVHSIKTGDRFKGQRQKMQNMINQSVKRNQYLHYKNQVLQNVRQANHIKVLKQQ